MREPWYRDIPRYWPIIVTALGLTVSAASANTRLADLTDKVDYIWDNGSPPIATRLARIDEREEQMAKTLDRVDHKLDQLEARQNGAR